ncbi:hypothetical protein PDE_09629 [Penicillium oxalicum 114-2]|uniref:Uncharacterized protein n=1 Tax=Penicillium oxalicum (strain 114-2 / CGMCC 5302) TaxID=933388 RepID=S7ZV92_PENO1|nr:hypothetical protein PDE_09629 [Penicillium oxalicum 114-2]
MSSDVAGIAVSTGSRHSTDYQDDQVSSEIVRGVKRNGVTIQLEFDAMSVQQTADNLGSGAVGTKPAHIKLVDGGLGSANKAFNKL